MTSEQRRRLTTLRIIIRSQDWHWKTPATQANLAAEFARLEHLETLDRLDAAESGGAR